MKKTRSISLGHGLRLSEKRVLRCVMKPGRPLAFGSNFGDALSPKIVQMVSGLRDRAAHPEDENVGDLDVINGEVLSSTHAQSINSFVRAWTHLWIFVSERGRLPEVVFIVLRGFNYTTRLEVVGLHE